MSTPTDQENVPAAPQPAAPVQKSNGLAISALVVGIITVFVAIIPFLGMIGLFTGLIALGLGIGALIVARKRSTGLVMSIIAMVLAVLGMGISMAVTSATVAVVDSAVTDIDDAFDATDEFTLDFGTPEVSYGITEVPVSVTNTTNETQSFLITIVAESPDGSTQFDSTAVMVSDLAAGQTGHATAMFVEEVPADAQLRVSDAM